MPSHLPNRPSDAATFRRLGDRAVVLGASLSGLLAARVLADFYREVTVVERDRIAAASTHPGALPAAHAHVLRPRGARALEELFPGFLRALETYDVPVVRALDELYFDLRGHLLSRAKLQGEPQYGVSRPFLESQVLRRVRELSNVTILDQHEALAMETGDDATRVAGVRISCDAAMSGESVLPADLVVGATGIGDQVGSWLNQLGYPAPKEQQLKVDGVYATRRLRLAPGAAHGINSVLVGATPDRPVAMAAFAQEDNHWVVTLAGFGGNHPPTLPDPWLTFAADIAPPWFMSALLGARPLGDVYTRRFPASVRRRYDKLQQFPEGLLVIGDAMASLNPIHAHGMTLAALQAVTLRDVLSSGRGNLSKRFFQAAAKPIADAWKFTAGADLTMPEDVVPGARSLPFRVANAYVGSYQKAAQHDPAMALEFLKVTGLEEPTRRLFAPSNVGRVVFSGLQRKRYRPADDRRLPSAVG